MNHESTISLRSIFLGILVAAVPIGSASSQACPFHVQAGVAPSNPLRGLAELGSAVTAQIRAQISRGSASAKSEVSGLQLSCRVSDPLAVTWMSRARARWSYPDLRFPAKTNRNVQVRMRLNSTGSSGSSGTSYGLYDLSVSLYDAKGRLVAQRKWTRRSPSQQIPSILMNVSTNTTYRLEVDALATALCNRGWARITTRVTFPPQPFILPLGVSAESSWAQIKNNKYDVPQPKVDLTLTVPKPVAGAKSGTVQSTQSTSAKVPKLPPMLLIIGAGTAPPCNIALGPHFGLSVLRPIAIVPFKLDSTGKVGTLTFQVPASAKGLKVVIQAAQTIGPKIEDLYSSNPVSFVVR
jgi:hypothetical protein